MIDETVEVFAWGQAVRGVDYHACPVSMSDIHDVFQRNVFGRCITDPVDHLGVGIVDESLFVLVSSDDFCGTIFGIRLADFDELHAGGFDCHGVAVVYVLFTFVVFRAGKPFGDAGNLAALDVRELLDQCFVGAGDDCGSGDHEAGSAA